MKRLRMFADFVLSYLSRNHAYDYWHCPHRHSDLVEQGDYFINFVPKTNYPGPFDAEGIPLLDLATQHWSRRNLIVYSPIVICQYALGWYSRYLRDNDRFALDRFLGVADWLIAFAQPVQKSGVRMTLLYTDYGEGPALSAMAQGLAISVWCRAFRETGNREYLVQALNAFNAFKLSIEDGGVVDNSLGFPVLEEWTNDRIHILNGHLFAFAAIIDLLGLELTEAQKRVIQDYYDIFLLSSLRLVEKADMFFWTRYSLRRFFVPNIASYFYHDLHIEMMLGLHVLTKHPLFYYYTKRWRHQQRCLIKRLLALVLKVADRTEVEFKAFTSWLRKMISECVYFGAK